MDDDGFEKSSVLNVSKFEVGFKYFSSTIVFIVLQNILNFCKVSNEFNYLIQGPLNIFHEEVLNIVLTGKIIKFSLQQINVSFYSILGAVKFAEKVVGLLKKLQKSIMEKENKLLNFKIFIDYGVFLRGVFGCDGLKTPMIIEPRFWKKMIKKCPTGRILISQNTINKLQVDKIGGKCSEAIVSIPIDMLIVNGEMVCVYLFQKIVYFINEEWMYEKKKRDDVDENNSLSDGCYYLLIQGDYGLALSIFNIICEKKLKNASLAVKLLEICDVMKKDKEKFISKFEEFDSIFKDF